MPLALPRLFSTLFEVFSGLKFTLRDFLQMSKKANIDRSQVQFALSHTAAWSSKTQIIKNAFLNQEFFLEYQPIVDLVTGSCVAVEALVRWQHPTLGVILPLDFLPQMKGSEMMQSFDQWVIQQACSDYAQLNQPDVLLAINISMNSLDSTNTKAIILETLQAHQIEANQLILELTETDLPLHPTLSMVDLNQLSESGIQIAIDDYGTGYSSLSYLKLPITILKIDQSFIAGIGQNNKDQLIIESTINLAHCLDLKVTAEGVETQEQRQFLQTSGCDYAQGFYFSESLSLKDLTAYLLGK